MLAVAAQSGSPAQVEFSRPHRQDDRPLPARRRHRSVGAGAGRPARPQMGASGDRREYRRRRRQCRRRGSRARRRPTATRCCSPRPGPLATNAFMYKTMPYNPAKWVPIAVRGDLALRAGGEPRISTASAVAQVIATMPRPSPASLTSATPGVGSVGQFATIEFELLADIKLLQVPYKGLSPAVADVLGRQCQHDVRHAGDFDAAAPRRQGKDRRRRRH